MPLEKKIYFTAGPATIPNEVMQQAHDEFLNYNNMDISIIEISHRSLAFRQIIKEAEQNLRLLMKIPDNYSVLFMHGGAATQFDAVAMNLCPELDKHNADYIVDGYWSEKAAKSASKYCTANQQKKWKLESGATRIPRKDELVDDETAAYRYYCDNETIQGLEFNYLPETLPNIPLVCDVTSNFLSKPIDVSKFGVIFASAQKNCGTSGLAIVIVRKDLVGRHMKITPSLLSYKTMLDNESISNTPLTFPIYLANLCIKWILKQGGLEAMEKLCMVKSSLVYEVIDNSKGFYISPVEKESRSRMNIVFLLKNNDLEKKFLKEAEGKGLNELKGHRSVGGLRASLYHGVTLEDVKRLVEFMESFKNNLQLCSEPTASS